jgi:hypothetical protein|eukprot:COSAG06_NODE_1130_length_10600_cov_4.501571_1_plen_123_part_00
MSRASVSLSRFDNICRECLPLACLIRLCVVAAALNQPSDYGRGSDLSQCYHHSELIGDDGQPQKFVYSDEFVMYQKKRAPTAAVPTAIFFLQVRKRALFQMFRISDGNLHFTQTDLGQQPEP